MLCTKRKKKRPPIPFLTNIKGGDNGAILDLPVRDTFILNKESFSFFS